MECAAPKGCVHQVLASPVAVMHVCSGRFSTTIVDGVVWGLLASPCTHNMVLAPLACDCVPCYVFIIPGLLMLAYNLSMHLDEWGLRFGQVSCLHPQPLGRTACISGVG